MKNTAESEIEKILELRELLERCERGDIPETIDLSSRHLSDVYVAQLMNAINEHPNKAEQIKRINLSNNQLTIAPDVTKCSSLKHLNLADNKLTLAPDLTKCPALELLDLRKNCIGVAPDVTECPALKMLYLSSNLLALPPDVTRCFALIELELGQNQLVDSPDVTKCSALMRLDVHNNCLTVAPEVTRSPALKWLNLNGNQLTVAPNITKCPAIERIYLDSNNLTVAPNVTKCPVLVVLSLRNNKLKLAPDVSQCHKLEELQVRGNPLTMASRYIIKHLNKGELYTTFPITHKLLKIHFDALYATYESMDVDSRYAYDDNRYAYEASKSILGKTPIITIAYEIIKSLIANPYIKHNIAILQEAFQEDEKAKTVLDEFLKSPDGEECIRKFESFFYAIAEQAKAAIDEEAEEKGKRATKRYKYDGS